MAKGLSGLGVEAKNAVANSNGRVPRIKEILKGLELVEEARKDVKKALDRIKVEELIKAINEINYGGILYLGDVHKILASIESRAKYAGLEEREIIIGILTGLAEKEVCKKTYDNYLRDRDGGLLSLSRMIQGSVERIQEKEQPKDMGISYYAPW